jgi:hypothetical protein
VSNIGDETAYANLYIGEDIVETVGDGDEYEEDDRFDWSVEFDGDKLSKIGLSFVEKLNDEDEVMKVGDILSFPNDYLTFEFKEVRELEPTDINFDVSNTDELEVEFNGEIEIGDDYIDTDSFIVNLDDDYRISGTGVDDIDDGDFTVEDVKLFVDDRELTFNFDFDGTWFELVGEDSAYGFNYVGDTLRTGDSTKEFNDDEDYRLDNGDIFYKSDISYYNDDKIEDVDEVTIGLVNDEDKEIVLALN